MTDFPDHPPGGNAWAQPGAGASSLALALTQRAVARIAKHLKIDLSDGNLREIVIARAQDQLKAASNPASAHSARDTEPTTNPGIAPLHVKKALNTYREINMLLSKPE